MKKLDLKNRYVPLERADSADHLDLSQMRTVVFPNLKPSTTTISLRLPNSMLSRIKVMANKQHVPYQSLIKMLLAEKIGQS
jgi:predicted DNA binding CopG/RHH family protein